MREQWMQVIAREIEQALLCQQTSFLAKVVSCENRKAEVQPLFLRRKQNGEVEVPNPIVNVSILRGIDVESQDVVLCLVCDRDLGAALYGELSLPRPGLHPKTGCLIIGVIDA